MLSPLQQRTDGHLDDQTHDHSISSGSPLTFPPDGNTSSFPYIPIADSLPWLAGSVGHPHLPDGVDARGGHVKSARRARTNAPGHHQHERPALRKRWTDGGLHTPAITRRWDALGLRSVGVVATAIAARISCPGHGTRRLDVPP